MTSMTRLTAMTSAQFNELLSVTQGPLYGFVRGLVGNSEEARDLVQDVFVDAWRLTMRVEPPFTEAGATSGRRRWLFHAAYCAAISTLRRRGVITWESLDDSEEFQVRYQGSAPAFDARVVDRDALLSALGALGASEVAILLLDIVHGFSSPEIAHILDIAPSATRKRLSRAMTRLRAVYFAQEHLTTDGGSKEGSAQ